MDKGEHFEDIIWSDGGIFREAEKRDGFGDPNNGEGAEMVRLGDESVGILFGNPEGPKEGDAKMRWKRGTKGSWMAISSRCGR